MIGVKNVDKQIVRVYSYENEDDHNLEFVNDTNEICRGASLADSLLNLSSLRRTKCQWVVKRSMLLSTDAFQ